MFSKIIDKDIHDLNSLDIKNLEDFLLGYLSSGQGITFSNLTIRSTETVEGYFSTYYQFAKMKNWPNFKLFSKTNNSDETTSCMDYSTYNKDFYAKEEVPAYISVEEFKSIILQIRNKQVNALRDEIIVRLEFENGCRIGEVLGLTFDDVIIDNNPDHDSLEKVPLVILRNRISDKYYQHAKNCLIPHNKRNYSSKDYNLYKRGYQYVCVSWELYNMINEYIEIAHVDAAKKYKVSYASTEADRVRPSEPYEVTNHYIFLNDQGGCLSAQRWNQIVRIYFNTIGIPIDKKIRKDNLNHRFRAGFAMFNIQYLKCDPFLLMIRMRHRHLKSTERYFKPTQSDIIKIKRDFIEKELYDVLPLLKIRKTYEKNV
jgi:integrase/recombinase XerD